MNGKLRYLDPAQRARARELCRYATTGPMAKDGGLVPALLDALDYLSPSVEGRFMEPADSAPSNEAPKVGDRPQRSRSVTYCARCRELETLHEIRADGSRGKRYGTGNSSSINPVACPGCEPGRVEERLPEEELRRRLANVLALHTPSEQTDEETGLLCRECLEDWPCSTVGAARGGS